MSAAVAGVGLLTGWGEGVAALPADARVAAGGRRVVGLGRPALTGERFRRATRECLLAVVAVEALLRDAALPRERLAGGDTALVYVTAAAYGASNVEFIRAGSGAAPGGGRGGAVHFPYTAPSAVPGEVAIEFGLTGAYSILLGGPTATLEALGHATRLLGAGRCRQALVLAVETFAECEELWARARWLVRPPLVETAACALLVPSAAATAAAPDAVASPLETLARTRAGETLACEPLIALALARSADGPGRVALTGAWRGRRGGAAFEAH